MSNTDAEYWGSYGGLQEAKHTILRAYLNAWFPILTSWSGEVLYIDCHAGRGRHRTGHPGSPIIALQLLLGHRSLSAILARCQVRFIFFERDEENFDCLRREIRELGRLPDGIAVEPHCDDYEGVLVGACEEAHKRGHELAPLFAFVDPYGFRLSMATLNKILFSHASELLINWMFRYVDMAMHTESQAGNMDSLFGTDEWRAVAARDYPERADGAMELFSSRLKADYVTPMLMRGKNEALKYVLFHATNHPKGREVMKEAMWKADPSGSFTAHERDHVGQLSLFEIAPGLGALKNRLWEDFGGKTVCVKDLYGWLTTTLYLRKHLHAVLKDYHRRGVVQCSGYDGQFTFSQNPRFAFPAKRPPGS